MRSAEERRALRVQFRMEDNPSLSRETLEKYKRSFRGSFYKRFILGEWCTAQGRVYDFFDESWVERVPEGPFEEWRISCDYGTVNPTSMGLWGRKGSTWYRVDEYYYDSRREGRQKTDGEYARELKNLAGERCIEMVIADPSAASFIETLRRRGFSVVRAGNDVADGIRVTADTRNEKLGFKVREAQLAKVPYILVVGEKEVQADGVNVRLRGGENLGLKSIADVAALIRADAEEPFKQGGMRYSFA